MASWRTITSLLDTDLLKVRRPTVQTNENKEITALAAREYLGAGGETSEGEGGMVGLVLDAEAKTVNLETDTAYQVTLNQEPGYLGEELVADGDLATDPADSGWTLDVDAVWSAGQIVSTYGGGAISPNFSIPVDLESGLTYLLEFDQEITGDSTKIRFDANAGSWITPLEGGSIIFVATATATDALWFEFANNIGSATRTVTRVSLRRVDPAIKQPLLILDSQNNKLFSVDGSYIAIGKAAAFESEQNPIAIGALAAYQSVGEHTIAIGDNAAYANVEANVVAIGYGSAVNNLGHDVLAIGDGTAADNGGYNVVALGTDAGKNNSGNNVLIIGHNVGEDNTDHFYINIWDELVGISGGNDDANPPTFQNDLRVAGRFRLASNPPANANSAGIAGTIAWSSTHIYVCTATNTWKRVAIATW